MAIEILQTTFTADDEGVFANSDGGRLRIVGDSLEGYPTDDGFAVDMFFGSLSEDDTGTPFPEFDSSTSYEYEIVGNTVVVTITVDYDPDSPWE